MRDRVWVIAEAGVNHNGSLALAQKLVDAAARAGADAVKFQTFRAEAVVTRTAPLAAYQKKAVGGSGQWEMIRRLELAPAAFRALAAHCRKRGIEFLSTPFDFESADLLADLGVKRLKVPSGEITNAPLLLKIASKRLPLILSTGMATVAEIRRALGVIAFGWTGAGRPSRSAFQRAYASARGRKLLKQRVVLLQCTTEYPAPFEDVNLRAMDALSRSFGLPVGLSDHTTGLAVSIAAAGRGARVIEKHLTLDRRLPGPDQRASLEPDEFGRLVQSIRQVEQALGDGVKRPMPSEKKNIPVARRSLTVLSAVRRGDVWSEANLGARRPGDGKSPFLFWDYLGRPAARAYQKGEAL